MSNVTSYEWPIPIENGGQVGVLVASALCIFISGSFVVLRLVSKKILGRSFDPSDYCIIFALHIDDIVMVCAGGFGFHVIEIGERFGPDVLVNFYKGIAAFPILWNVTICFSKLSVILMYTALIPVQKLIWPARILGGVIILWNVGGVIAAFALCQPFSYNWDQSQPGHCGSQPLYYTWLGIINVITDVLILVLPMPFLYKLQLRKGKKIALLGLFSVGFITCAITIYRQTTLPSLEFTDMTYSGLLATVLSGIEPTVAIIVACVPFLRPIFGGKGDSKSSSNYNLSQSGHIGFSKKARSSNNSRNRQFEEIDDDSSDIQLRPVNGEHKKQNPAFGRGSGDKGFITVETQWEINYKEDGHGTSARDHI
ncbi:hypothetical protein BX600DRAFT_482824 [Xylariales sp. PMI_506]|nr:hypothetical protein BX600DRAFT_482824 [Xylariales sp. PMI_506]